MPPKRLLWPTLATAASLLVLLALGFWQVQRLDWKLGLIQRINERVHAAPVPIETVLAKASAAGADVEYTHVEATGRFHHGLERYLYATGETDWGWDVLTPLELAGGQAIIVNRGFVPRQQLDRAQRTAGLPEGIVTVTGLVRAAPAGRSWSIPAGDPVKGTWYWPEIDTIAASMGQGGHQPLGNIYVESDPISAAAPPVGGVTNLDLPNRHLEYALTWFGLAGALIVIYGLFAFRQIAGRPG